MVNVEQLQKLYKSYGFEIAHQVRKDIYVFLYKKSRYFGVDIIPLSDEKEVNEYVQKLTENYSGIGYAVNIKRILTNEDAELELFKSFFSYDYSKNRILKKYEEFFTKQTKNLLGFDYQYIESPFELHNHETAISNRLFEIIDKRLSSNKSELIIIEAAAGYGKTCTAFEILNKITNNSPFQLPVFTELSRNRGANIFRYILLDEIDLEFPALNSELVLKEIKNGRIPIIVDGFDELLEKINTTNTIDESFDEVESMLDTIGTLLEFKAKVVLTTRKTAIFTGLEFEQWLTKWNEKFNVTRISIKEPRLEDWLGEEKYEIVKEKGVPIKNLANPVLLTFIKNIDKDAFLKLIDNPSKLIDQYFIRLLEREKDRQNLIMTVENQLLLFKNVTKSLISLDTTVEDKDFFKLIILDGNKRLLEETKNLYGGNNKQTIETLVDTLCTHALLDRKGRDENQIGFINDFVFGIFIGEVIIDFEEPLDSEKCSNFMIETAVTAFRVQTEEHKIKLWNKIECITNRFLISSRFLFDVFLREKLVRNYSEVSIYDTSFFNVIFFDFVISSSIFVNCNFQNCVFDSDSFSGVSFINCRFINCSLRNGEYLDVANEVTAIKCSEEGSSILIESDRIKYFSNDEALVSDIEKMILQKLWNISNEKGHHIVKLTQSIDEFSQKKIYDCLKNLEEKQFLDIRGVHVYFNINKTNLIKQILEL